VNDGQRKEYDLLLGSKVVYDGGIEFVHVGEVEIESAMVFETFGTQGALMESAC